tara:strand:- start:2251 stop:2442 length:192 start_codon:yes stop_codon:yes gene_type:complete
MEYPYSLDGFILKKNKRPISPILSISLNSKISSHPFTFKKNKRPIYSSNNCIPNAIKNKYLKI